jgi:hypothetical protein
MKKTIQILLFIISYIPLYLILSIQNINGEYLSNEGLFIGFKQMLYNNKVSLFLLCFSFFSIISYFILYKIILKSAATKITITKKIEDNEEHLSYLVTYILPFTGLNFSTLQSIVATIVLFSVLGSIYIRTNLILTNPTLILFGFIISKVETTDGKNVFLIHKKTIKEKENCNCVQLTGKIYILKP